MTKTALGADELFNGYIGAHVVFALHELGLLRRLEDGPLAVGEVSEGAGAVSDRTTALLRTAEQLGLVERDGDDLRLTVVGRDVLEKQGFFTWAVGGYGTVLQGLAQMESGRARWGDGIRRDEGYVALGSGEADERLMREHVNAAIAPIRSEHIADIGCGGARRLIEICSRTPHLRGTGIDISQAACDLATQAVRDAHLEDRIAIECADVRDWFHDETPSRVQDVDTVMTFFMLHDLLNRSDPHGLFTDLRAAFPAVSTFVVADTVVWQPASDSVPPPIFSLGFELVHAFMGVRLHAKATYEELFASAALTTRHSAYLGAPGSWLYVLETGD